MTSPLIISIDWEGVKDSLKNHLNDHPLVTWELTGHQCKLLFEAIDEFFEKKNEKVV